MIRRSFLGLAVVFLVACGGPPKTPSEIDKEPNADEVPAPLPVVKSTTKDALACARLRDVGCSDGTPARGKCEDVFGHARTNESRADVGKTDAVAICVIGAIDIAAVRKCGRVNTLTFECPNR